MSLLSCCIVILYSPSKCTPEKKMSKIQDTFRICTTSSCCMNMFSSPVAPFPQGNAGPTLYSFDSVQAFSSMSNSGAIITCQEGSRVEDNTEQ